jgi:2,3-dihydroxy-p-cumate/2,3-dihydroxybenzoate 3,4-dioxygenase
MKPSDSASSARIGPIVDLCYVRLAVKGPGPAADFAADVLGLQRVPDKRAVLFRSDHRYHTLSFIGSTETSSIGLELRDEASLERVEQELRTAGFEARRGTKDDCDQRFVRDVLITRDASGNEIDLVLRPAQSGRRYFPSRDAGVTGLQGVGLRSLMPKDDARFWISILGTHVSDWVGDITYLRFDHKHHRLALYPSDRPGILYVSYDVESLDAIMQSYYFAQERQIKVVHGPGREPASGQIFIRLEGPEGHIFCYSHGLSELGAGHRPRQFSAEASSLCEWGSEPRGASELQIANR